MQIFQSIVDVLQEIFMPTAPEVKKRVALRKIESELKSFTPCIYKNDMLQANFAESLRILFNNTKSLLDLLSETLCSEDLERNHHFVEQLIMTGFSADSQKLIESLSYENRKEAASKADSLSHHFERERVRLEKVIAELKSSQFSKIDKVIDTLMQLNDICHYNYMSSLRLFDPDFSAAPNYLPKFSPIPLDLMENSLQDLYYVLAGLDINKSTSNAVCALNQLRNGNKIDRTKEMELDSCLKKIQGAVKTVFKTNVLKNLVRLAKGNPELEPERVQYKGGERARYGEFLENRFVIDEGRLKNELQNETIGNEVKALFAGKSLETLKGYNSELNNTLKQSTPCSFFWILPMQVLKSFLTIYYKDKVQSLLNDIAIEGFFNQPEYKSDFAEQVYAVNDGLSHVEAFEHQFETSCLYDENLILGFVRDSHRDAAFIGKLKTLVDKIEKEAKMIVQREAMNIFMLYDKVAEIVVEAKKPTSDIITNLKVLTMSTRNREKFDFLDTSISQWKLFLDIMKDYVTLNKGEKKK
ncbi:MAG: hypothetical protein IJ828_10740 [Treponema sp.]|nr:hypothetical protein [Treponema sp.]